MTLTPAWLDELRSRTLLSALIGKSTKITRAGREWKACCPFHDEKTPSFTINDEKGFYHCFGCGAHGDAIRWMTDQRGLAFMDAVKELAAAAGMDVPAADPRAAERAQQQVHLRDVTEAAARWFRERLLDEEGASARAYLKQRGLSRAMVDAFGIGFAPDARGRMREVLAQFGDAMAVEAGMLIQPAEDSPADRKHPYDRFRGRLMIPIRDTRGRTIAFGGRILGPGEPKYLNSPDTPLFDKGRLLYNLDRAAPAARKASRLIIVEGYMDVIALAQAGVEEAVAPLGTALTEAQIELAWRQVPVPMLALDGDAAGQRAAMRAALRALPLLRPGHSLAFITLPPGKDPDDVVRDGGAVAFNALAEQAIPLAKFLYREAASNYDVTLPDGRAALRETLENTAKTIDNKNVSSEYRKWFVDKFYGDFGWKKGNLVDIKQYTSQSVRFSKESILNSIYRSILFGLVVRPQIAIQHIDIISDIKTSAEYIYAWREAILDQIESRPSTSADGYVQMAETPIGLPRGFSRLRDIIFPWNRTSDGYNDQLGNTLILLKKEQECLLEMQRIDDGLMKDPSEEVYYALQRRLVVCTENLHQVRSAMMGMFNDDSHLSTGSSDSSN